ncbi:MAG TPA: alpha/beta hydrolase [Gemmatimonadaceae bacterium]
MPNLVNRLRSDFAGVTAGFVGSMFTSNSDTALANSVRARMTAGSPAMGIASAQSLFEWYRDSAEVVLNRITQPLWTINSSVYVGADPAVLKRRVPRLEVRMMDGVGHFVMLEAPATFNRHLNDAISAIMAGERRRW